MMQVQMFESKFQRTKSSENGLRCIRDFRGVLTGGVIWVVLNLKSKVPNQVFNLTYLGVTVLAFGNNRAAQNAG
jgi:hypothetical protein